MSGSEVAIGNADQHLWTVWLWLVSLEKAVMAYAKELFQYLLDEKNHVKTSFRMSCLLARILTRISQV